MSRTVLILGATGATGRHLTEHAAGRGWTVRAAGRSLDGPKVQSEHVSYQTADVLEDDLTNLVSGTDAVISALGLSASPETLLDPPPLYTDGTRAILTAMRSAGVRRLVTISAAFVETLDRGPLAFRTTALPALKPLFDQMADMEAILRDADDIDWTAVRPGWLMGGAATGDYAVTPDVIPGDLIRTRHADLAAFMLDCVAEGTWLRQTPAIARAEHPAVSSPLAVMDEVLTA